MKRHAHTSPKLAHLSALLNVDPCYAVGVLERLWWFAATQAPRGDVGRWTDAQITLGIGSQLSPELLVSSLVGSGWLDGHGAHRLVIHDWEQHADQTVRRSQIVQRDGFIQSDPDWNLAETSGSLALSSEPAACRLPPEPEPAAIGDAAASQVGTSGTSRKTMPLYAAITIAYAMFRTEIAALRGGSSGLPAKPSKTSRVPISSLISRYPEEPPDQLVRDLVHGAWMYWMAVNKDADEATRRARLTVTTLCRASNSDKYLAHGRAERERKSIAQGSRRSRRVGEYTPPQRLTPAERAAANRGRAEFHEAMEKLKRGMTPPGEE